MKGFVEIQGELSQIEKAFCILSMGSNDFCNCMQVVVPFAGPPHWPVWCRSPRNHRVLYSSFEKLPPLLASLFFGFNERNIGLQKWCSKEMLCFPMADFLLNWIILTIRKRLSHLAF